MVKKEEKSEPFEPMGEENIVNGITQNMLHKMCNTKYVIKKGATRIGAAPFLSPFYRLTTSGSS